MHRTVTNINTRSLRRSTTRHDCDSAHLQMIQMAMKWLRLPALFTHDSQKENQVYEKESQMIALY